MTHSIQAPVVRARAARLARALRGLFRVRPGDRVAVLAAGRPEVFELLFACGHAGAALLPLNWRLADAELAEVLADAAPALVVACPEMAGRIPEGLPILSLGGPYEGALAAAPAGPAPPAPADELAALVLYTSGTTGRPKGAVLPWRQLRFNAAATAVRLGLGPADRCLAFLPLFHTGGLNCLATPLLSAGGEVVLMERFDPEAAVWELERRDVTATIAVPTMYRMLLEAGIARRRTRALRHLLCGGAPLPDDLRREYRDIGLPLAQGFGLTEAGPNCFSFGDADVGAPMPGTEARLCADGGREAEVGEVGELWLRGPHLFSGYFRQPEASAKALEGGWLRTGDLMRRDQRGRHWVAGRAVELFISGGENVYPAEVERALALHPQVAEVAVVGVPDPRWGEVGLAAVVPRAGAALAPEALVAWARARLAAYKVPRHVEVVAELARGLTGKVQKSEIAARFCAERRAS
jgi:fatty-acyl-CoA synthase